MFRLEALALNPKSQLKLRVLGKLSEENRTWIWASYTPKYPSSAQCKAEDLKGLPGFL